MVFCLVFCYDAGTMIRKLLNCCLLFLAFTPIIYDKKVFLPTTAQSLFAAFVVTFASVLFVVELMRSETFRGEVSRKAKVLLKNPIVLSVLSFLFIFGVSALFAVDTYGAFWGNLERGEGFVGILYFVLFFMFSLFVFEKKDWLWFFKLTLFSSLILLGKEFLQYLGHVARPGSFAGNTSLLAGYFLFSIFSALVVLKESIPLEVTKAKSRNWSLTGWKYFSIFILICSVLGIFILQTRGTILGLGAGIFALFLYGAVSGKNIRYKKIGVRKLSVIILCLILLFSATYVATRKNAFWQKVPGISRLSEISSQNDTTQSRLVAWGIGLDSVSPKNEGIKKLLLGWGPENFVLAFAQHYNPELYRYDSSVFDRSHNKLVDALVMTGLLGLLAYLVIWFFFLRTIVKSRISFSMKAFFYFFAVAYFIHLMFLFDSVITWIPFMGVLAFAVYMTMPKEIPPVLNISRVKIYATSAFSILALALCFIFLSNTMPGYAHMRRYVSMLTQKSPAYAMSHIDSVFVPSTYAEGSIVNNFLDGAVATYGAVKNQASTDFLDKAIEIGKAYLEKRPQDYRSGAHLINALNAKGDAESLSESEKYARALVALNPAYPGYGYELALSLSYQKKYDEALSVMESFAPKGAHIPRFDYYYANILFISGEQQYEKSFNMFESAYDADPSLYTEDTKQNEHIYVSFFAYYYGMKNKEKLHIIANRLSENKYEKIDTINQILKSVDAGIWPKIN